MDKQKKIEKAQIDKAMAKFIAEGKLIKKLPDQIVPRSEILCTEWGAYELPTEAAAQN